MSLLVPSVIESTQRGDRSFDLYSRLLANRIIFIGHPIGTDIANLVCAQILHLAAERADEPMSLYINSPGGELAAMLAIYDTMQHVPAPVATICFGHAASAAAILVAAGAEGRRMALPNSRFLLHQPATEGRGQITDLMLQAAEIARQRSTIEHLLATHTGRSAEQIRADTDRDLSLSAAEALQYGLIDEILDEEQPSF